MILNPTPKKVIKSLVSSHEFPDTAARDQQELKGKGLVMLLHGTPGTGNYILTLLHLRPDTGERITHRDICANIRHDN